MDTVNLQRFATEAERLNYTPAINELIFDQSGNNLYWGDGTTTGGILLHLHDAFVSLPNQQEHAGDCLHTDGVAAAWEPKAQYSFIPIITDWHYASAREYIRTDSSAGALRITMPAAPSDYDRIIVHDINGSSGQHPVWVVSEFPFAGQGTQFQMQAFSLVEFTFYNGQWAVDQGGCDTIQKVDYQYGKTWVFPLATEVSRYVLTDGQLPSSRPDDYALYIDGKEVSAFTVDTIGNAIVLQDCPTASGMAQLRFWCSRPAQDVEAESDISVGETFYFTSLPEDIALWQADDSANQMALRKASPSFTKLDETYTLKKLSNGKLLLWLHSVAADGSHTKSTMYLGVVNPTTHTVSWTVAARHPTDKCRGLLAEFGNGQLLMGGGFTGATSDNAVPDMYLGTFSGNSIVWTKIATTVAGKLHDARNSTCTLHDGRIFALYGMYSEGGAQYSHYTSGLFSVNNKVVSVVEEETPFPCAGLSVTQLPDRRLLVTGTVPSTIVSGGANKTFCYLGTINADDSIAWQKSKSGIQAVSPAIMHTFDGKLLAFQSLPGLAGGILDTYYLGAVHGNSVSWVQNILPVKTVAPCAAMLDTNIIYAGGLADTVGGVTTNTCVFSYYAALRKVFAAKA